MNEWQTNVDLPFVLTVEEAASVLRISRSSAYEQVRLYEVTNGDEGIPSLRVGRRIRIPRAALLEKLLGP